MYLYLKLSKVISNEEAQGLVDYALIVSLVALVLVGSIFLFGQSVLSIYENIKGKIPGV